jgi:hypothetical protein
LPDCETARYNAPSSRSGAAYTELTDGDDDIVAQPSWVSNTYLANVAA